MRKKSYRSGYQILKSYPFGYPVIEKVICGYNSVMI